MKLSSKAYAIPAFAGMTAVGWVKPNNKRQDGTLITEPIYFYILAVLLIFSASAVIFAPRMFLAIIGLFLSFLFTGLICASLNAIFVAMFQFILCGLILCPVIFLSTRKISLWDFPLRLVKIPKIVISSIIVVLFCAVICLYVREEFSSALLNIFSYVNEKSADLFNFSEYLFPMHIVIILTVVAFVVIMSIIRPTEETAAESGDAEND